MCIGFSKKLHAAGICQRPETIYHFRHIQLKLLKRSAGYRIGYFEISPMMPDKVEHQLVSGEIAILSHFPQNSAVFMIIKIVVVVTNDISLNGMAGEPGNKNKDSSLY